MVNFYHGVCKLLFQALESRITLCVGQEIAKRRTYFGKQTVKLKKNFAKVSKVGLLFDFNLQYRSIYATFKLLAQLSFASALNME